MPSMNRRETSRLRAEIAEGMVDYVDQQVARNRVRRCGTVSRTASVKCWDTVFGDLVLPKGAYPLFAHMRGMPNRFSVLH